MIGPAAMATTVVVEVHLIEPSDRETPPPILRVLDQFGSKCVAFDIPTQDVEMIVIPDWETLESALVHMSLARRR